MAIFERFCPHVLPGRDAVGVLDLGPLFIEDVFGQIDTRVSVLEALVGEGVASLRVHVTIGGMLFKSRLEPGLKLSCGKGLHLLIIIFTT